jgi:hypothetical protein
VGVRQPRHRDRSPQLGRGSGSAGTGLREHALQRREVPEESPRLRRHTSTAWASS